MKKIFILTGEPSGDKLASTVISKLKKNITDIEYLCVGGTHLNSELKNNQYVNKIISFINSDKKRPISLPENIK